MWAMCKEAWLCTFCLIWFINIGLSLFLYQRILLYLAGHDSMLGTSFLMFFCTVSVILRWYMSRNCDEWIYMQGNLISPSQIYTLTDHGKCRSAHLENCISQTSTPALRQMATSLSFLMRMCKRCPKSQVLAYSLFNTLQYWSLNFVNVSLTRRAWRCKPDTIPVPELSNAKSLQP